MDEFTKLKKSVLEQAEIKGQEYYQREINKLDQDYQKKMEDLDRNLEESRQAVLNKERHRHDRLLQQISNKERQTSLVTKQEILKILFAEARKQMKAWPFEKEFNFLKAVLKKHQDQTFQLVFGQETYNKFTSEHLEDLKKNFSNMTISQETIPSVAGFKLVMDKIDYNYLYDDLVSDSENDISLEISDQVFTEETLN